MEKLFEGAKNKGKKSPIHMVSAWSSERNLVLEQIKVNEKSNEITAIPKLLDFLDIEDATIKTLVLARTLHAKEAENQLKTSLYY